MGERARRLVHASGAALPLSYLADVTLGLGVLTWPRVQALLVVGVVVAAVLEALRLTGRIQWPVFEELTRGYEAENVAGYALYVLGMAGAALLYPPTVALPAMLMLTVGDPISGLLSSGGLVKRGWVLLAMFGVCTLLAAPFVPTAAAVAGAATATVADGYKPVVRTHVVDDNLTIPLLGGLAMWLALAYAG